MNETKYALTHTQPSLITVHGTHQYVKKCKFAPSSLNNGQPPNNQHQSEKVYVEKGRERGTITSTFGEERHKNTFHVHSTSISNMPKMKLIISINKFFSFGGVSSIGSQIGATYLTGAL